jgi:hypothetical protein
MKFIPYGMSAERNLLRCFCFIGENDSENYYEDNCDIFVLSSYIWSGETFLIYILQDKNINYPI